jgi:hypothetical protein
MGYKVNGSFYTALCLSNWLKGISIHFEVHAITWKFKPFFAHNEYGDGISDGHCSNDSRENMLCL